MPFKILKIKFRIDGIGGAQILYESKADDIIFIEADRYRVAQVVTNLLSNALKFVKGYDGTRIYQHRKERRC